MCFSAELEAAWRDAGHLNPHLDFDEFARLFRIRFDRRTETKVNIPKMLEAGFANPQTPLEREIKVSINSEKRKPLNGRQSYSSRSDG